MLRDHVLNVIMHLELDIQSEQTAADMSITGNISKRISMNIPFLNTFIKTRLSQPVSNNKIDQIIKI